MRMTSKQKQGVSYIVITGNSSEGLNGRQADFNRIGLHLHTCLDNSCAADSPGVPDPSQRHQRLQGHDK